MIRSFTRRDGWLCAAVLIWAIIGFVHYLPAMDADTANAYLRDAWQHLRYSDIAFLHFRDHLADHPIPYVNYTLEYPVLLGSTTYVLSFAPSLFWYFSLTFLAMTIAALIAVFALDRLPGADAAYFAFAPGLALYLGLNWDLAAIALCVIGLWLYPRGPVLGSMLVTAAVWFKLFPVVILGAMLIEEVRHRRYRSAFTITVAAALTTAVINGPLAIAYYDRWSRFFRFNRDRGADSNVWVFMRDASGSSVNLAMTALLLVGGLILIAASWRSPINVVLPLGASLLCWWMVVNKTYQPQYFTWLLLACALLRPPWVLWAALAAIDLAGYAVSFLYQYQIHQTELFGTERSPRVEAWTFHNLYEPIQVVRSLLLLCVIGWGITARLRPRWEPLTFWRRSDPVSASTA